MTIITGRVRAAVHGAAAAYQAGDKVYVASGDKWVQATVQGVKRDHVCVWGKWWPCEKVSITPPSGETPQ